MVSKTILTVFTDRTNKDQSNNDSNDKCPKQTSSSSSYTAAPEYDSDADLVEVREIDQKHNNNNSKFNGKMKF
jgi:hypothetical protein